MALADQGGLTWLTILPRYAGPIKLTICHNLLADYYWDQLTEGCIFWSCELIQ